MRNVILVALCVISFAANSTPPIKGGYLGKRVIIGAEGSYSPNYSSLKDMLFSYNLQYGGNIHFITGRYSQLGFSYNMYALGAHQRYNTAYSNSGKIKGYQIGITYRKFRQKRGGLAPIGKFIDVSINYHSDEYNVKYETLQPLVPVVVSSTGLSGYIGLGTQGIFRDRIVANAGLRLGGPIYTISSGATGTSLDGDDELSYMKSRLQYKDYFSVFFGIGIIL